MAGVPQNCRWSRSLVTTNGRYDGDTEIGNADVQRMLKVYLDYELNNTDKITKRIKASFDLCNQLTMVFCYTKKCGNLCMCC